MAAEAATASGTLPVVKISLRARVRLVAITAQTRTSCSNVSRSGLAASATALKAPELQPTSPSGRMPASRSALRTPTLQAPRLPPPPRTKTNRRCFPPGCAIVGRRRRHQVESMDGDRQKLLSRIGITVEIPIRACATTECNGSVAVGWKLVDSALLGMKRATPGRHEASFVLAL